MKTDERRGYAALFEDEETAGGGLALAGWGVATIAACVLGFASWQYAPPRSAPTEVARADSALPDPTEVTGSISLNDRGQPQVTPSRVVGAAKVAPMPLASNETVATSRDIEQLRMEIKELQRRIAQMGLAGDGVSRRVERLEEKVAGDPAAMRERLAAVPVPPPVQVVEAAPAPPRTVDPARAEPVAARAPEPARAEAAARPAEPVRVVEAPKVVEPEPRAADRIPLPSPRPAPEAPVVTGSIPPRGAEAAPADAKTGRGVATTSIAPPAAESPKSADPAKSAPAEPAKAEAPPQEATAPQPVGEAAALDLGGYRTLASLRRSWNDMTTRYAEFGNKMEPLARLRETDNGMEARLLAGPYVNQAEAAKSCIRLRALGVTCAVTGYSGQPLSGVR